MRFFNTEGPVRPDKHYAIPPLDRVDIDEFLGPIRAERYFVLHAPRQTDKTSALIALRDLLNSGAAGNFRCVDVNVEVGQVARDDTACGLRAILGSLAENAQELGDNYPQEVWPDILAKVWGLTTHSSGCSPAGAAGGRDRLAGGRHPALGAAPASRRLTRGAPEAFPQSVVLCGVCDIRDYRIRSSTGAGPRRGRQPDVRGRPLVEEVGVRRPWLTRRSAGQMRLPEASAREVAVAAETKPSNCLTKQDHLRCC